MTYEQAASLLATARNPEKGKPLCNNTRLFKRGENYAVRLHDTDVVTLHPDGTFTLSTGGWETYTTKDRINSYSPAHIWQEQGIWYVGTWNVPKEDRFVFRDGMVVDSGGKPKGKTLNAARVQKKKRALDRMVRDYIKAFVAHIEERGLPTPNGGDCWFCFLQSQNGVPMGEEMGDVEHLMQHLRDKYIMGSLLWNAINDRGYRSPEVIWHMCGHGNMAEDILRAYFRKRKPQLMKVFRP